MKRDFHSDGLLRLFFISSRMNPLIENVKLGKLMYSKWRDIESNLNQYWFYCVEDTGKVIFTKKSVTCFIIKTVTVFIWSPCRDLSNYIFRETIFITEKFFTTTFSYYFHWILRIIFPLLSHFPPLESIRCFVLKKIIFAQKINSAKLYCKMFLYTENYWRFIMSLFSTFARQTLTIFSWPNSEIVIFH